MIYQGKQRIWSEYQKEIPTDHWFYVRSCIRQSFFPASEKTFLEILRDRSARMYMKPRITPPAAASPTTAKPSRRKP